MANRITSGNGEDADAFVCLPVNGPLVLPDNVVGKCSMCGCAIQHRPVYPKKPPKVCLPCALPQMEEEADDGNLDIQVRPENLKDIKDWRKKGMN